MNQSEFRFNGADYIPSRDDARLSGQILRVWECMEDENWRTLREIANITGDPEASISAQLRHLRKERFGGHKVEREYVSNGLYKYRLLKSREKKAQKK
jgi:hypothetical protein